MRIGVDIGGTGVRVALVVDGTIPTIHAVRSDDRSVDGVLARVERLVGELTVPRDAPIGLAVPGWVHDGVVRASPNFPAWRDVPLARLATARLGRPARVANDADCAALGAGRTTGCRSLLLLTLGTGVGGGVLVEGRLLPGRFAAELGHIYTGGAAQCGCGARGCLEASCSVTALQREARALGLPTALPALVDAPLAAPLWAEARRALAVGLRSLINSFGPEVVALSGGLCMARGQLEPAVDAMRAEVLPVHRDVEVRWLGRADGLAILGAAALWDQRSWQPVT